MNEKNVVGESKPKQSRRQAESAPELLVRRAYAVEPLAVGKVLNEVKGYGKSRYRYTYDNSQKLQENVLNILL